MGKSTDRSDEVEIEEIANPVSGGDDGDGLPGKIEDLASDLLGLVSGVVGGHDGEGGATGQAGVGECWALYGTESDPIGPGCSTETDVFDHACSQIAMSLSCVLDVNPD